MSNDPGQPEPRHRHPATLLQWYCEPLEVRVLLAGTPIYRVNAGGPELSDTPPWEADDTASIYNNATTSFSDIYSTDDPINVSHPSIPPGTPAALFKDERWDPPEGQEMIWTFPVTPDQYEVRLYFAEIFPEAQGVGLRVFDVSIENVEVLSNYDIFADVGGYAGTVKSFLINSDASLQIKFLHQVENPAIKAIEILTVETQPNQLGTTTTTIDFGNVTTGTTATRVLGLTNLGSAGDPSITITGATITGSGAAVFGATLPPGGITLAPGQTANLDVTFTPNCHCLKTATLSIQHTGNNSPVQISLSGQGVVPPISFGKSTLTGAVVSQPTSLQFGPDGRLYVAQMDGAIKAFTIARTAPNSYSVAASETINLIKNLPNRNDDGSAAPAVSGRLMTGLLVVGTPTQPVIYAVSADPRMGGGEKGSDTDVDTNSGILSRLTKNGSIWTKLDLVRGLPRSEEQHSGNGLTLNAASNTLFIAYGGHTNMGAPSRNFVFLPEYALSGAILSVDLDVIGNATYDLPTLNDEDRPGTVDANDPFGGNHGKNQAKLVPGGPVQVYAPGFRNPYDLVITQAGKMYSIDNGSNAGWGDVPLRPSGQATTQQTAGQATNAVHEPGVTRKDNLKYIPSAGYYGGHPNPTRANLANRFNSSNPQSPVTTADPRQGWWNVPQSPPGALAVFDFSTNGLVEYISSHFGGGLKNHLLAASHDNAIYDIELNAAGTAAVSVDTLFNGVGELPLDVTTVGDGHVFAGTIWVADYLDNTIVVFEPDESTGCTGVDDPNLDEDGDGYDNHDEILNGTSPCSAADVPPDNDGDFNSDLLDSDDDNDGLGDTSDPFAIDTANGRATDLPVNYEWEAGGQAPGGFFNLGFKGLMSNGTSDYLDLFDPEGLTPGGAAGVLTVDELPAGTAFGNADDQQYAFQFGIDVDAQTPPFVVHTQLVAPFLGVAPQASQQMGVFFGTGDQDNYVELALDGDGNVKLVREVGGMASVVGSAAVSFVDLDSLDLKLHVNPSGMISASFVATVAGVPGASQSIGPPVAIPSTWFAQATAPAAGIIATRGATTSAPSVTWEFMRVRFEGVGALDVSPTTLLFGAVPLGSSRNRIVKLTHLGAAGEPNIVIHDGSITGARSSQFTHNLLEGTVLQPGQSIDVTVTFTPSSAGEKSATLDLQHSGIGGSSMVQLSGLGEFPGNGKASVALTPGGAINASTTATGSFVITNQSPAGIRIQSLRIDLSNAMLPDLVFDPNGAAGDTVGKPFTADSGAAAVGLLGHVLSAPHDLGFDVLEVNFADFGTGEVFTFSIDADPTSIRGVVAPGPNQTGNVSGLELSGATVTVTFSDGTTRLATIFREPGSAGGSNLIARAASPPPPLLQLLGVPITPTTLTQASQTARIIGPAGENVRLLIVEGGLYTAGVPGGGFDLDPFEANTAIHISELPAVIGSNGFVDVPIILTRSEAEGGMNHIVAATVETDGRTSVLSSPIVVFFDPINQPPVVKAGADTVVPLGYSAPLNGTVSDDGLPLPPMLTSTWSKLSGPGAVNFTDSTSASTTATFSALGIYVLRLSSSDGQLTSFDDLMVTVARGPTPRRPFVGTLFSLDPPLQPPIDDLDPDGIDDLFNVPSMGQLLS